MCGELWLLVNSGKCVGGWGGAEGGGATSFFKWSGGEPLYVIRGTVLWTEEREEQNKLLTFYGPFKKYKKCIFPIFNLLKRVAG